MSLSAFWNIFCFLIRAEIKAKQVFISASLFVLLCVFIFYFSFNASQIPSVNLISGVLWITYMFFVSNLISNLYQRLVAGGFMSGIQMTGCGATTLFFSICGFVLCMVLIQSIALILIFDLFFQMSVDIGQIRILTIVTITSFGVCSSALFLMEVLQNVRLKDILFPILYLPINMPLMMASVKATKLNIVSLEIRSLSFLVGMNLVLFVTSWLLYDVMKEELA
ncbi:MAG: heme exporter protein CcmB [Bdellovibrionales bacterium]|nr:heme exporter protein CcmB [Bdellovibrionales bacterium]